MKKCGCGRPYDESKYFHCYFCQQKKKNKQSIDTWLKNYLIFIKFAKEDEYLHLFNFNCVYEFNGKQVNKTKFTKNTTFKSAEIDYKILIQTDLDFVIEFNCILGDKKFVLLNYITLNKDYECILIKSFKTKSLKGKV